MENWLIDLMSEYGYLGIVFLIAIENIFPPIPSEVILTFGGFMTTVSTISVFGVVIAATIGSVLGAAILYMIGVQLEFSKLEMIVERWGHILRVKVSDIQNAEEWFKMYGPWTVFFCRFVPIIRSLISIPAGMSRMHMGLFLLLTTLGTLIWNFILVYLGASVGSSWHVIVTYMDVYAKVIYVILVILVIGFVVIFLKRKKQ